MYEFTSRIRYSEVKPDGKLSVLGLANRMQDCSVFHSIEVGRGPEIWLKESVGWVIVAWQIHIFREPEIGERITTRTQAYQFRGFEANRHFILFDEKGETVAMANSNWAYFDMAAGRPIRIPQAEMDAYGLDEPLDMEDESRKISIPDGEAESMLPYEVHAVSLDTNGHVNNARYIEMAVACLTPDFPIRKIRVQYIRQAKLGDVLVPKVWHDEKGYVIWLECDGRPYAVTEFQ